MRSYLVVLAMAGLLLSAVAFGQSDHDWNTPSVAQGPGADLIAWSAMQSPEPVPPAQEPSATPQASPQPEPRPETPPPQTQPAPQAEPQQPTVPGQPTAAEQAQGESTQPVAQTFTGTIDKDGDNYVLKVSDTTSYKLDDQAKAGGFVGQRVRVLGALDNASNMIHVQKIEPLS